MDTKIYDQFKEDGDIIFSCDSAENFVKNIPDEYFQLIITSPPYNIGKKYEERTSINAYLESQKALIGELVRVLRPTGSICWQVGNYVNGGEVYPLDIYFYEMFKKFGLQLRNRIIWTFGHGLHASKRFSGRYETILWFTKTDDYTFNLDPVRVPSKYPGKRYYKGDKKGQLSGNPKGKNPSDIWRTLEQDWDNLVWDIPNVKSNHPEKVDHPCQFPIELVERCVLALTDEGDCVFDPYAGVASSLLAAIKNNRRAFGVDKERDYIAIGTERIQKLLSGELKIREIGTPIFEPTGKEKVAQIPQEWRKNE